MDDTFSDASQSMDELLDRNNSLNVDENFFESLDEATLDDMARSAAIRPSRKVDDMPTLDRLQMEFLQMERNVGFRGWGAGLSFGQIKLCVEQNFELQEHAGDDITTWV
jgi:hypothetical protein